MPRFAWQAWHFVTCGRLWYGVSKVAVSVGEAAKLVISEGFKVSKVEEVSHEIARFEALTCLVLSLWFSSRVAVFMGEAAKHVSS